MRRYSTFYKVLGYVKNRLTFPYPIVVRRTKLPRRLDGDCRLKDGTFLIRIEKKLPEYYAIDVLLHELSHCLAWDENLDEMHGPKWGEAYSLVYRTFLEWLEQGGR